jgi:hypothetical protein
MYGLVDIVNVVLVHRNLTTQRVIIATYGNMIVSRLTSDSLNFPLSYGNSMFELLTTRARLWYIRVLNLAGTAMRLTTGRAGSRYTG